MRQRTVTAAAAAIVMASVVGWFGIKGTGTANAIANGDLVAEGQFTFSVKLIMLGIPKTDGTTRDSACSGALIAPEWVITGGHCFRDENNVRVERPVARTTTAYVGRNNIENTAIGHEAQVIAVRQAPNLSVDFSLAKLDTPITDVAPLQIADAPPAVDAILRLTGFGAVTGTVGGEDFKEKSLRTGQMAVTGVETTTYTATGAAPQRDTTPCPFDSGAPFFTEGADGPRLVGLDSDGPDCPHQGDEILARVDNQKEFIQSVINAY